jgi:hypothetical protein
MDSKKLEYTQFPSLLAPDEEKGTKEYGLKWAKAIEWEWFNVPDGGVSQYYNKRNEYNDLRLYARGEQRTDEYERMLGIGKDDKYSYTNYDLRPIQVVPKFVKEITNQMSERLFEISAESTDKFSTDLRDDQRSELERLRISKDMLIEAKALLGVDLMPEGGVSEIPDSKGEVDLRMKVMPKLNIEIATEEALKYTLDINDYGETQRSNVEDVVVIGICGAKNRTDPNKGIIAEYVDPADMVYAYPTNRNFKDVYYFGEVKRITISELDRLSSGTFTREQLEDMGKSTSSWSNYNYYSNQNYNRDSDLDGSTVDVLHFTFKALNTITYKKKYSKNGGFKMTKRESTFKKGSDDNDGYEVVTKKIDVWYQGSLVLGTEHIFNYKKCENMVREKGFINKTFPPYIMYAPDLYQNRTKSLVGNMRPYVDQMQMIHIKLQQMVAQARPNGIFIDVSGLSEVALGDGNTLSPLELLKIYDQTGNVIGTSSTDEGEYNHGKLPITELRNGVIDGLPALINSYNHYLNLIRDAIGIPLGADASTPHPDMAVGVQQQLALNSNTATKHILDASLSITDRLCTALSMRLNDIFKDSDLKAAYTKAIGKINVELLKSIEDYSLHDLGINIELKPDIEEKQYLESNIQIALSKESITLDDAIDVRSIGNIKLANEVLKDKRRKREQEKKDHEKEMIKANADANAEAAERASQAKLQEVEVQSKIEIAIVEAKKLADIEKLEKEAELKSGLMEQEFSYNSQLKGLEVGGKKDVDKMKEDGKLTRQNINNTQNSEMISQRDRNAPPINFESQEDDLSGDIGLGDIGPT